MDEAGGCRPAGLPAGADYDGTAALARRGGKGGLANGGLRPGDPAWCRDGKPAASGCSQAGLALPRGKDSEADELERKESATQKGAVDRGFRRRARDESRRSGLGGSRHLVTVTERIASARGVEVERGAGPALDVAPGQQGQHVGRGQHEHPGRVGQGQAQGRLLLAGRVHDHRLQHAR